MTSQRDPKGNVTQFAFDELGRQTSRTLPAVDSVSLVEQKGYDDTPIKSLDGEEADHSVAGGQLAYEIDFQGHVTAYFYDNSPGGAGKLVEKRYFNTWEDYDTDIDAPEQSVSYT
jgi:YD repeat-containing protein